jgi:hypothetical protein
MRHALTVQLNSIGTGCVTYGGIHCIKGVLSVNEAGHTALLLNFCNRMHRQRGLAAALWPKYLQPSTCRNTQGLGREVDCNK